MSGCLSFERLDRLASGSGAAAADDAHLAGCAKCRGRLASMAEDSRLFSELRQAVRDPVAGAPSTPPEPLTDGAIEGYTLERELHRGTRSAVYAGRENDSGRKVAIKVLFGEPWTGARDRERFAREIELAASLDHPHIVPVRDSGYARGLCWLVTPLVSGRHLDAWVREVQPDQRTRLVLFARLCRAVDHAHRCGIIHRDLKPANILIDDQDEPQILDFGLARSVAQLSSVTLTGQFVGTPAYAAPEQVRPGDAGITTAVDVHALGVILYEMLTGALPYDVSGTLPEVVERICHAEPLDPRVHGERIDYSLRAILLRALEKNPSRRQASAGELAADVERYLAGDSTAVEGAPRWYLLGRWLRRHRRALAVQVSILVVASGAVAVFSSLHFRAESQRATAEQIQSVLRDVLASARPDRMGGGVELVDVLENAASRIEESMPGAADVRAAVQLSIGETYQQLLLLEEAQTHLEAALERFRAVDGDPPLSVARTLQLLGTVLAERSDPRADEVLREALAIRRAAHGADDPLVAACERDLAYALLRDPIERSPQEAKQLLQRARASLERAYGTEHPQVARTLHVLADWRGSEADRDTQEALLRRAAAIYERSDSDDSAWAVQCSFDLAALLGDRGEFEEAESWLQRGAAITERHFGDRHATDVLRRLARLAFHQGDLIRSEQYSLRAVARELAAIARRKPSEATRLLALAGRLDFATAAGQVALVDSFRAFRDERGLGAYEIGSWLNGLAALARACDRAELAEALLREAVVFHCRIFGHDCPVRLGSLEKLGEVLNERGACVEALTWLREAFEVRSRTDRLDTDAGRALVGLIQQCERGAAGERDR